MTIVVETSDSREAHALAFAKQIVADRKWYAYVGQCHRADRGVDSPLREFRYTVRDHEIMREIMTYDNLVQI